MNIEQRILKLEKSNKYYKVIIIVLISLIFMSNKDIFIKDEIRAKTIYVEEIIIGDIEHKIFMDGKKRSVINICKDYWSSQTEVDYSIFEGDTLKCNHSSSNRDILELIKKWYSFFFTKF